VEPRIIDDWFSAWLVIRIPTKENPPCYYMWKQGKSMIDFQYGSSNLKIPPKENPPAGITRGSKENR
jgi:hypothetical protein